jgi:hypothetical protein
MAAHLVRPFASSTKRRPSCSGSTCSITARAACAGANTRYLRTGSVCNDTPPCCRADMNQSGAVTVRDIFDFLAGYFTQSPAG